MLLTTDFLSERQNSIDFHANRILSILRKIFLKNRVKIYPSDFIFCKQCFIPAVFFMKSGINPSERYRRIISLDEISTESLSYFTDFLGNEDFVIGYELTDLFKNILSAQGVMYVNIWLHPVRFMDDELFMIETNSTEILERLKLFDYDKNLFYISAEYIKIYIKNNFSEIKIPENTCIVFGQTQKDKTLRSNNGLLSLLNYKEQLLMLKKKYNKVLFSRHPYASNDHHIVSTLKQMGINIIKENSYKLLACDRLATVATISSSIGVEAYFFNKNVFYFNKMTCDIMRKDVSSIDLNLLLQSEFWDFILYNNEYKPRNINVFSSLRNKSRNILRAYYSYEIIEK